eukprot:scaffold25774_cov80-Cyclotella_meneghiniana.AAC.2
MSPLREEQAAGLSTAESECSGSCSSRHNSEIEVDDNNRIEPKETTPEPLPAVEVMHSLKHQSVAMETAPPSPKSPHLSPFKRIMSSPTLIPAFKKSTSGDSHGEPRRHTVNGSVDALGLSSSNSSRMNDSAPTVLIRADAEAIESKPIQSIMISRTLHESLHRGSRTGRASQSGSIKFGQVNIREYERVLGDNPSVTSGPPLSIGWRYAPELIKLDVDTFESGKGLPRSSSEYLVPKAVRERILREHAEVSRHDIAAAVRTINRQKQQRRKTVVNISMSSTEERLEKIKHGVKKVVGKRSSYIKEEARLWDNAHEVAMEKAKRLEDSIRKGEKLSSRELLRVGTLWNTTVVPSRRNSVGNFNYNIADPVDIKENQRTESCPTLHKESAGDVDSSLLVQSKLLDNAFYKPSKHQRRVSIDSAFLDSKPICKPRKKYCDSNFRHSDSDIGRPFIKNAIVATEIDNNIDDILANLVLDESTREGSMKSGSTKST